ncbi:glycosyltransferase family 39 protein [Streptomyces sp. SB3404]|uniref:Glycosyltransferase family 39 protein n=1 Tax=Streptomyces boncukensis TaxID=2711219 RepID=A0A6G4WXA9_9ACTN|nr:glycosyltransferase family 39 protein [Streptomyces boncukensis]NGO69492.1 glycosyltransferase family 39 protein [Streptomyces boncukensis]
MPRRLRVPSPDLLVCCGVLAAILCVQGLNITGFPELADDEGTYVAQARAVQRGEGLAHYTYWYDHPPLGWIQLAGLTWLPALLSPGVMEVGPVRGAMLAVSGVSAVLLYLLARRLRLPCWAAGLGMALYGLSPLSVELQRKVFLDNLAVPWMLLAFLLAASPSRHLWHHFAAGLAAAVSVLTKETMLLVLPALLVTLWSHSHRDTRKFALTGAVTGCALVGLMYPLFALLHGELLPAADRVSLTEAIRFQLSRPGSGSMLDPDSPARRTLDGWLYYDRVLPLGGLLAALAVIEAARWSRAARAAAGPALAVLLLAAAIVLRPSGYIPAMYIIQALPFLALSLAALAALTARLLLRTGRRRGEREGRREHLGLTVTRWTVVWLLAGLVLWPLAPRWAGGLERATTADVNRPHREAAAWMAASVDRPDSARVLLDDRLWLNLVHQGFRPRTGAIWYHKADLDPEVARSLVRGWRSVDYVVASRSTREDAHRLPTVGAALAHSERVAVFGSGPGRVEIRKVAGNAAAAGDGTASGSASGTEVSSSGRTGPVAPPRRPSPP